MQDAPRPGLGSPSTASRAVVFLSLLAAVVALSFIAYGAWKRESVYTGIKQALQPTPPANVDSLRDALRPSTVQEIAIPASETVELPRVRFVFNRISMLILDAYYEPETGGIKKIILLYWLSEPVDLQTKEGLAYALGLRYPWVLGIALIFLALAVGWWRIYLSPTPRIRIALMILWAVLVLPVAAVLILAMSNYYMF